MLNPNVSSDADIVHLTNARIIIIIIIIINHSLTGSYLFLNGRLSRFLSLGFYFF